MVGVAEYPVPPLVILILSTIPDVKPYGSLGVADCLINEELEFKVTVPSH